MLITKFNRFCHKHGRTAFLIIAIIIVFPFVFLWRAPVGRGGGGGPQLEGDVGTMYGRTIELEDFQSVLNDTDLSVFMRSGGRFRLRGQNAYRDSWIEMALQRMRSLREARKRGLDAVSDMEVADHVRQMGAFGRDGVFDPEAFRGFSRNMLRSEWQMSGEDFDRVMREDIVIARLERDVTAGVVVSPQEVRDDYNARKQQITVATRVFEYFDLLQEADYQPEDAEIQAYFDEHRGDLRLPDRTRVRVAIFDAADYEDQVTLTDTEIAEYYEDHKAVYEKEGQDLAQATESVRAILTGRKARSLAQDAARRLKTRLDEVQVADLETPAAEVFAEICAELGVEPRDSGPFTEDEAIPNIGNRPNLARVAARLNESSPFSRDTYDAGIYYVACWLETIPGAAPDELVPEIRETIVDRIRTDRAVAHYDEHTEPFRAEIEDGLTPDQIREARLAAVDADEGLTDEEKDARREEIREQISTHLQPYYREAQKRVRVATFAPADLAGEVSVTDEEMQAYYDDNPQEFGKEQVKVQELAVTVPEDADEDATQELRGVLDRALDLMREGVPFASLESELADDGLKAADLGWVARGDRSAAFDKAVFELETGQVSEILELDGRLALVLVEDSRDRPPFDEVKDSIRTKLEEEAADELAHRRAVDLADAVYRQVVLEQAGDPREEILATEAEKLGVATKDTDWFSGNRSVEALGYDYEVARALYGLGETRPVSSAVKGRSGYYIACWLETKPGYLPSLTVAEGDEGAGAAEREETLSRVRSQLRRRRALDLSRERARETYEQVKQALADGTAFADAAPGFEEQEPFTPETPPTTGGYGRQLVEALESVQIGELVEPLETASGAVVAFVKARTYPTDEEFEEERDTYTQSYRRRRETEVLGAFQEELREASDTQLAEAWRIGSES